jgi:XTP/dITP diphosphohydrolase/tetrapyrrole methylase family protein/MazG family protein
LPALMFAEAVWKQIAKKKLPAEKSVDTAQVAALGGHLNSEVLGRLLFELAAAAQAKGLDPEDALRQHAAKVMHDVEARIQPATA